MLRSHILRIEDPVIAKRWRAFWLLVSLIVLAPLVYMMASVTVWFRGRGLTMFALADWVAARTTEADGDLTLLGLVVVMGLLIGTVALYLGADHLKRLYGQRYDDLRAESIFARISRGEDADEPFVLYLRPFISTAAFCRSK